MTTSSLTVPVSYTHLDVYKRQITGVAGAGGQLKFLPRDSATREEAAPPPPPKPSAEGALLTEIRDLLKEQKNG